MKKKVYTAFICLCCAVVSLFAQERVVELTNPNESCTSIAAGKLATTDGSVMTSQTCDGTSRTWMEVVPAQNWSDTAKLDLYWDLRHTESKNDRFYPTGSLYICLSEYWLSLYERETAGDGRNDYRGT